MKLFFKKNWFNIMLYMFGFFIMTLGINLLIRSELGAGPWDTVSYNLSRFAGITLGMASGIINLTILSLILLYRRKVRYLIMLIPIFSISLALDFWDLLIFGDYYADIWYIQGFFFLLGVYFITFALALIVSTGFPAMLFEELTLASMGVFKIRQFALMRIILELFAITLATIIGFIGSFGFGAVNVGSVVVAFAIASLIDLQLRLISKIRKQPMPKS